MARVKAEDTAAPDVSVTWPVNAKEPTLVGVPAIVPLLLSVSPSGREPPITDHE